MHTRDSVPAYIAQRRWWLLFLLAWAAAMGYSLHLRIEEAHSESLEVATEGARDMFRMIVLARAWNARHGGVYVPVTPELQPNPYLDHPRRDLVTTDGLRLTMVNPAFMTRLLAEMAYTEGGTVFHITSLKPIRPKNGADDWERQALLRFEQGVKEVFEVVVGPEGRKQLRYMAPLLVSKPCMVCHEKQGYKIGDIRGGISISQDYAPIQTASQDSRKQLILLHASVFLLVAVIGGGLLELLRHRWLGLSESIGSLEQVRKELETSNRALTVARDSAETAMRAKQAFLSNVSHEMRTPLNAVSGTLFLLRREATDARQKELLERVESASQQLLSLIDRVIDLSRLESGEFELQSRDFSLDILLADVFQKLRYAADAKGLGVRLERDPVLPASLHGDDTRIAQLLGHYIDNAVKFSVQGEIVLAARRMAGAPGEVRVRFEVRDQGVGISPEQQARLFQLFEQGDMSRTRQHGGTGVGLVLCKRLAEVMGGTVGVASVPDSGSVFWFEVGLLPALNPDAAELSLRANDWPAKNERPQDAASVDDLLARLDELLARDDLGATVLWRENTESLRAALGELAQQIEAEITAFRFDMALALLRKARR